MVDRGIRRKNKAFEERQGLEDKQALDNEKRNLRIHRVIAGWTEVLGTDRGFGA